MRRLISTLIAVFGLVAFARPAEAVEYNVDVSLRGSPNSMLRQNQVAKQLGYTFVEKPDDLTGLVEEGAFVPLLGNDHYVLNDGVSYPYARPEVRLFVERLAEQYHEGTGEKLVVTSLTRPMSRQPRNSHDLSVHPAGIAIDLRISSKKLSRAWLESVLLKLERRQLLDITRERYPPHYHVAIFPEAYRTYVEGMIGPEELAEAMQFDDPEPVQEEESPSVAVESAPAPEKTAATALLAVDSKTPTSRFLFAALPLSAILFFLLGYWRGSRPASEE